jgi:hypothetical protein
MILRLKPRGSLERNHVDVPIEHISSTPVQRLAKHGRREDALGNRVPKANHALCALK